MRKAIVAVLLLAGSAGPALGQRGMGGGGRRGGGGGGREGRGASANAEVVSSDELAKLDPARRILDKAKSLHLEDSQKQALDSISRRYDWNPRIFARQVDSLVAQ